MRPTLPLSAFVASLAFASILPADWNQWRGPNRNGISDDPTPLSESWPAELPPVWQSEPIPSDHEGGHGSPVVADGRVFLTVVWHRDVPTTSRTFGGPRTLASLGHRGGDLTDDQKSKLEDATFSRNSRLRGDALEQWAKDWVAENLDETQAIRLGSWCIGRIRMGKSAIPLAVLDALDKKKKHVFDDQAAMDAWLAEQAWAPDVLEKIRAAVPTTTQEADDVVLCLDADSGDTLWKFKTPGTPSGRKSSSTPCVKDGRVFALGGSRAYCLDAKTGEEIWRADVPSKGAPSSFLVEGGVAVILAKTLRAFNAADGSPLWTQEKIAGDTGSPVLWNRGNQSLVVCHGSKSLAAADLKSGDLVWEADGGGQSTPVASDNYLVVFSGSKDIGLRGYVRNEQGGVDPAWSRHWLSNRYCATPIIHDGHAYLLGGSRHLCVRLSDGEVAWEEKNNAEITSPILADGKLLVVDGRGSRLLALRATPDRYEVVASAKIGAMQCPTPALSNGRLFVRTKTHLACFDLRH